jgi:hypothetical protein
MVDTVGNEITICTECCMHYMVLFINSQTSHERTDPYLFCETLVSTISIPQKEITLKFLVLTHLGSAIYFSHFHIT